MKKSVNNLSEKEQELILLIRNRFRYGEITLVIQNGIPQYVTKTYERVGLGEKKKV